MYKVIFALTHTRTVTLEATTLNILVLRVLVTLGLNHTI